MVVGRRDARRGCALGRWRQCREHVRRPGHRCGHASHPASTDRHRCRLPQAAVIFSIALEAAAFLLLWRAVNLLSALLALAAALFYVFVYSVGLKRRSTQNIVIGGAAGAVPVLVGWSAVTDQLGLAGHCAVRDDRDLDAIAFLGTGRALSG